MNLCWKSLARDSECEYFQGALSDFNSFLCYERFFSFLNIFARGTCYCQGVFSFLFFFTTHTYRSKLLVSCFILLPGEIAGTRSWTSKAYRPDIIDANASMSVSTREGTSEVLVLVFVLVRI